VNQVLAGVLGVSCLFNGLAAVGVCPSLEFIRKRSMGLYDRHYYGDRESDFSWRPGSTWSGVNLMIAACIAVYALDIISMGLFPAHRVVNYLASYPEDLKNPLRWFSFLTYGFTHAPLDSSSSGIFHILMNMFVVWMFGRIVESKLGKTGFLTLYLLSIVICGISTAVIHLIFGGERGVIGASGAVMTVLMFFIFTAPNAQVVLFVIPMPAWVLGVIVMAQDIIGALFTATGSAPTVAHETHIIGAILGALFFYKGVPGKQWLGQVQFWWRTRNLRVVRAKEGRHERLAIDADKVLEKVNQSGYDSLTSAEKKLLEKYSRELRQKT